MTNCPVHFNPYIRLSLLTIGLSSVTTQLVILRETLSILGGNEISLGFVFGVWIFFTGLGSYAGTFNFPFYKNIRIFISGQILLSICPILMMVMLRYLPTVGIRGEVFALNTVIINSIFIYMPFCFLSGFLLTLASGLMKTSEAAAQVYIIDSIGDILGGVLFSFIFVHFFSHWLSLIIIGCLILILVVSYCIFFKNYYFLGLNGIVIMIILIFSFYLNIPTLSIKFPGQSLKTIKNTPFGQLATTRSQDQLNVYHDGVLYFSTANFSHEKKIHLPLCQVNEQSDILLVSGGVFGTLNEILKHRPLSVDYVELDPEVIAIDSRLTSILKTPIINTHIGDGRLFIKTTNKRFDAIIIDLPDPENAQLNRFYSLEFFLETKKKLKKNGIVSFSLSGADNYLEEHGLAMNRSVYAAAKKAFQHVLVFPGETLIYILSDAPITLDFEKIITARNINTEKLMDYELFDLTAPFRLQELNTILDTTQVIPNSDFRPIAFLQKMNLWQKITRSTRFPVFIFIFGLGLLAVCIGFINHIKFTILTTGYCGMAHELTVILLFQIIFGYAYLKICVFITLFMIGSALGGYLGVTITSKHKQWFTISDGYLVLISVITLLIQHFYGLINSQIRLFLSEFLVIPAVLLAGALISGFQFTLSTKLIKQNQASIAGNLYFIDGIGATLGTLMAGIIILPYLGLKWVITITILIKSISFAVNLKSVKSRISRDSQNIQIQGGQIL